MNPRPLAAAALAAALAAPVSPPRAFAEGVTEQVVLRLEDFLKLYEKTRDAAQQVEAAPREFAVSTGSWRGRVVPGEGDTASAVFDARLHIEVLKVKGWVAVPLLPTTVALRSARIGTAEAAIVQEEGWYTLVTDRRGGFDLDLQLAASVFTSEGTSSVSFELPETGGARVELAVPAKDALDFTVANARLQSDRVVGGDRVVEAVLPGTGSLAVEWQREIPEAEVSKPRVYAETYTLVSLGDGLLEATSTVQYTILQAGVDRLEARIPAGVTLLGVEGAGVRDFTVAPDGKLTVALNYAALGAYRLTLRTERAIGVGATTVDAPIPAALGVERSKGWLGVEARGNLEIAAGETAGTTPVDVRVLPAAILGITDQPVLLGFKYLGAEPKVPLKVSVHQEVEVLVTLLDQADVTTMFTTDGRRLTSVTYRVRNNRRQYLRLEMPDGATLWSAQVAGRAVQPAKAADGRILIPLVRSQASGGELASFNLGIVYVEEGTPPSSGGAGKFRASLPTADVPITFVGWSVYAPAAAKVKKGSFEGSVRHVAALSRPFDPKEVRAIQTAPRHVGQQVQHGASRQADDGGLGQGAAPVEVDVPLEGIPQHFEKLLALGEELWVGFSYAGLK